MTRDPGPVEGLVVVRALAETESSRLTLVRCAWTGPDPVVLKRLRPGRPDDEVRLFRQGTTLARRIRHPSVLRILGAGLGPGDGPPWILTEWHAQGSLAGAAGRAYGEVLHIGVRMADVLQVLHAERAVHRDVKPANILLDSHGEPVLGDFHAAGHLADAIAVPTAVLSPKFAAPEVLEEGRAFSIRSEVYSLCATLQVLTGADAPAELIELLDRGTADRPADRPDDMTQLARLLRDLQAAFDLEPTAPLEPPSDLPGPLGRPSVEAEPASVDPRSPHAARHRAADELAVAVSAQWEDEAGVRRLNDPHPLPVSWTAAPDDLVVEWDAIESAAPSGSANRSARAGWAWGPDGLGGVGEEIVGLVARRIPTGRLLVLGEPGSGKSVLLLQLVLGLLHARLPESAVPVLLPLSSWDPISRDLRGWIRHSLLAEHPWLRQSLPGSVARRPLVDELLDTRLVLPVLDGLDEVPAEARARAVERINDWLGASPHNRVVVSCRGAEFRAMIDRSPAPTARLAGTAGVEIQPLDAAEVRSYLRHETGEDGPRLWAPLLARLGRRDAIDTVFRVPLMVAMARTVYVSRLGAAAPPPRELLDRRRFPDRESIERHLFDGFLPAAYRDPPGSRPARRWSAGPAEHWLRHLARHLGDPAVRTGPSGSVRRAPLGTADLAWWELHASVPPGVVGAATASLPAVAVGLAALNGPGLGIGLGAGLLIGVLLALVLRSRSAPGRPVTGIAIATASALAGAAAGGTLGVPIDLGRGPAGGLIGAIGVGLAVGPLAGRLGCLLAGFTGGTAVGLTAGVGAGPVAGLVCGAGAALAVAATVELAGRRRPAQGIRKIGWSWGSALAASVLGGLAGGVTAGPAAAPITAIAGFCLGLLSMDADPRAASSPLDSLRRDRTTFLLFGALSGTTILAGAALTVAPVVGLAGGLTVGIVFASLQAAWGRYVVARTWLALRGRLPFRLMSFLDDAHRNRGVLRRIGMVYQFRHADLQRRLVERGS